MRLRRLSLRTEETYLAWIIRYIRHHGTRHPAVIGEAEVLGAESSGPGPASGPLRIDRQPCSLSEIRIPSGRS